MDYKKIRQESDIIKRREKLFICIAAVLVCIIAVQCVTIAVQHGINRKYKNIYDEALETQLNMQEAINKLQDAQGSAEDSSITDER